MFQATKLCEKDDEEHWDLVTEAVRRNVLTGEREIQRRKKEVERATMHANKQLEAEKKLRCCCWARIPALITNMLQ